MAWNGSFYQTLKTAWHVERQADPYHLAVRQLNKAKSSQFSLGMFPVSRSRDARKRAFTAFIKDIKARSSSIIKPEYQKGLADNLDHRIYPTPK